VTSKTERLADARAQITKWREHPASMVRELFQAEPDVWQEEALEAFPTDQRQALLASKGPGKELRKDAIIPTPLGDRLFGDLKVGDQVFAIDGSPTTVTAVFDNGMKPVWQITFDDGASIEAGTEHQWKVRGQAERNREGQPWSVLTTREIIARGVRVKNGKWSGRQFEIPLHGAAEYPAARLPVDPYLVGVWIGDGTRARTHYHKPSLEVEFEIRRRGYQTSRDVGDERCDRIRILGCDQAFRQLECFDLNSPERFVPEIYKIASVAQRQDIVSGLMDTDGCIGDDGHMEFDSTSSRLALDMVWLVRSLGGNAFLKDGIKAGWYYDEAGNRVVCHDCYRVTIRLPFNPFRVTHKKERWTDPMRSPSTARYLKRYIDKIEASGVADCMCITVDHPEECYLATDFIVTHNTAYLAWIAWNFLLTRSHPKCAATSITGDNLDANLWTEMAKWRAKSDLLQRHFTWTKTRIFSNDHPETWWMQARSWPVSGDRERQAETLAGLHADYVLFLLDESGGIPLGVLSAAEGGLSTGIEAHIVQAGNPTTLDGSLYHAHRNRHLWHVIEINGDPDNPGRSPRVSAEWARQQIEAYGRDNPWVLVNVFGKFPPSSLNALLSLEEIEAAMRRVYREYDIGDAALVLGVDVARFGDDASVIYPRRGIQGFSPLRHRNLDSTQGASLVARVWNSMEADACFIDNTGGFGSGWIDQLRLMHKTPIGVGFAERPHDSLKYANKRAEMYFDAAQWIKGGGALPESREMKEAFTRTTYTFAKGRLLLEPKEDVKQKLGYSPDEADAFVLTFAEPIAPSKRRGITEKPKHTFEHDPYANLDSGRTPAYNHQVNYDPFPGSGP
jgi:hypothetical protein